jgi:hypothetical protein
MRLSSAELRIIGDFLADAAGEFSDHSCNDFAAPAIPENRALFIAVAKWQAAQPDGDRDPQRIADIEHAEGETVVSFDNWVMGYFAQRCHTLASDPSSSSELSRAELALLASVLNLMVEYREIDRDDHDITVDYTLSATDENKRFLSAVAAHEGATARVQQAGDEISVPDYWVMRYFEGRCSHGE